MLPYINYILFLFQFLIFHPFYQNNYDLINLITIPKIKELLKVLKIRYELVESEKIFIIKDFNAIINLRTLENINEDLFSFSNDLFIDYIDCLSIEEAELKYNKLLQTTQMLEI